ncbi:serine hydrolase domain-containing protein [Klebsiella grimontii]|uniref:serine hydrolase domain-containing protein n=1 Tax=Klebsiella grimontii TaxID=2058152 RepID=UPI002245B95E|nr:serine hydrolase domain-containing protein [Klebsiella grimontii]MCW9528851.1 serine hydrolase [Klebsiella grimontii]
MGRISHHVIYLLVSCAILFCTSGAMASVNSPYSAQDEGLATLIKRRMQEAKAPALAVSVNVAGQRQRFIYGLSDVDSKTENSVHTVYELGSMSKAFTGLAIQSLIQAGKLSLNDDIATYLPELRLRYQGQPVKLDIADFLYHTSGLPFATLARLETPMPAMSVAEQLQDEELLFAPKSQFYYASANYDVLGAVIEKITGKTYADAIATLITAPLGMSSTVAVVGNEDIPAKASGYKLSFGEPVVQHAAIARNHVPAAYIHSTLQDMEIWIDALLNVKAVSSPLRQAMDNGWHGNNDVPLASDNRILYGSGWFIDQNQGPYISHGGQNPSFSSCIALQPEQQIGIVALANINSNVILQLCADIDNYLRIKTYADSAGDAIASADALFTNAAILLFFLVVLISALLIYHLFRYRAQRRGRKNRFRHRDYVISLAVPLALAALIFVAPGVFSPGLDWRFILLWGPSSVLVIPLAIILLGFLLTLNHRIKRIIFSSEGRGNE